MGDWEELIVFCFLSSYGMIILNTLEKWLFETCTFGSPTYWGSIPNNGHVIVLRMNGGD
jgi:hypothetical protein